MTIQLFKTSSEGKSKETAISFPDCAQLITTNSEKLGDLYYQECYGCCSNDPELYKQFDLETSKSCLYLGDTLLFRFEGLVNELIPTKDFARFSQPVYVKLTDNGNDCEYSCVRYYKLIGIDDSGIEVLQLDDRIVRSKPFLEIKRSSTYFEFFSEYDDCFGICEYITEEEFNEQLMLIKEKMKI